MMAVEPHWPTHCCSSSRRGARASFHEGRVAGRPLSTARNASRINSLRDRFWALANRSTFLRNSAGRETITLPIGVQPPPELYHLTRVEAIPFIASCLFLAPV